MANRNFYDGTDAQLASGTQLFAAEISSGFASYGLTSAQATSYDTLSGNFVGAYDIATNPVTRTKSAIAAKNAAKTALKIKARDLVAIINATPTVTDEQKINLGLHVRNPTPTPVPVPDFAPVMTISNVGGNTLAIKLREVDMNRRGKPPLVKGAAVYFYVGEETPDVNTPWIAFGNSGRANFQMEFPSSLAQGTKVWIIAAWYNNRGQYGPSCQPMSTLLLGQTAFQQGN
ncbi:MAG TPA: hypothetical protein PK402_14330, partial [Tepidisphaeraceae bacterium]|nr:hypothetical protein [Tepidisphaeraceae bacterium]